MSAATPEPNRPRGESPPGEGELLPEGKRERRLAPVVEAFLRQVRSGGSLDPEPFLHVVAEDLRAELEVLLCGVLRLEQVSEGLDQRRREAQGERDGVADP